MTSNRVSHPDVFICHATEDKTDVARPIAESLRQAGVPVWFDEYSLSVGDSLRRAIDNGLSVCQWGVVVLSPAFFAKAWPQAELDGLFAKEVSGTKTILPVWHNVDRASVLAHSPLLADRWAARMADGIDEVVLKLLDVVRPDTSHRTRAGLTLSVTPATVRLHTGEWSVTTPLRITNLGDKPAYAIQIKLTLEPTDLDPATVKIQPDEPRTSVRGRIGNIEMSPDAILYYLMDADGRACISVWLHTVDAKSSREVIVSGTKRVSSSALVKLWAFQDAPSEMLDRKNNSLAVPIEFPEAVTLKAFLPLMRRTE